MCSKAAIELMATWAAALSCWKSFFSLITLKKKEHKDLPKNLSECVKKEDGSNYIKNLNNLD